jgi:hypothetical protein
MDQNRAATNSDEAALAVDFTGRAGVSCMIVPWDIVANREDLAARLWRRNPQSKNPLVDRKTREVHA